MDSLLVYIFFKITIIGNILNDNEFKQIISEAIKQIEKFNLGSTYTEYYCELNDCASIKFFINSVK